MDSYEILTMRYAVMSDIHSNLEALHAVLDDAAAEGIDEYLYVGDVVGYAADPKACIAVLKSLRPKAVVAGNHDWAVIGRLDIEYFNEFAKAALVWTKGILDAEDLHYLRTFQILYEGDGITLVHSSLENPENFDYLYNASEVCAMAGLMRTPLCFVGHTHRAGIFCCACERPERVVDNKIKIDYAGKYVINVGSVGQPRDGDPRASYAVYDAGRGMVEIKRIGYDIAAAQGKIVHSGLPGRFAARLSRGY